MNISLLVPDGNLITNHGYGVATHGVYLSLVQLGHRVTLNDPTADVELAFCTADQWQWSDPDAYHIGYMPWESTRLPADFIPMMETADELWATSDWCKWVFEKHGFTDVRVYQHGVNTLGDLGWSRRRRTGTSGVIRFLHMGEPALRKGGQLAYETFVDTFGDRRDVSLTIKAWNYHTIKGRHHDNVRVITDELPANELIELVRQHDVLIYPSWGEGFGLIPLQAMATGMPVICTEAWAPYKHLLIDELKIESSLTPSPWPDVDPGNMYRPDPSSLAEYMRSVVDDFELYSLMAYDRSFAVETEYDWITLTEGAFRHVAEKFDSV